MSTRSVVLSLIVVSCITALSASAVHSEGQLLEIASYLLPPDDGYTIKAALGDVDGDGDIDIVFGSLGQYSAGGANSLHLNNLSDDGSFYDASSNLPTNADATYCTALADVDGDGDLDIMFGNKGQNKLYLNDGSGLFTDVTVTHLPPDNSDTWDIEFGDYDGDGDADAYLSNGTFGNPQPNYLYLNDGNGVFTSDTTNSFGNPDFSYDTKAGDVDGDGDLDLIVVNGSYNRSLGDDLPNRLYLNDGSGHFTDATSSNLPSGSLDGDTTAEFGDVDGDGDLDLLIGYYDFIGGRDRLFLNDGSGIFTDVTTTHMPNINNFTIATRLGDMDADGDLDIFSAIAGNYAQNLLYLNDGSGFFTDATSESLPEDPVGFRYNYDIVLGDLDGDGYLDAFATGWNGDHNQLYLSSLDPNRAPQADAGPDQTVPATFADGSANVILDGTGSFDPDGDQLTYEWSREGGLIATGETATVQLSLGQHEITLTVSDGSLTDTDTVLIVVEATPAGISGLIDDLVTSGDIEPGDTENLNQYLADADVAIAAGNNDKAIKDLDRFKKEVDKLKDKGKISTETADLLFGSADAMINTL